MSISDGRIVTEIMRSMILGKTLTIFGDGTQTRSLSFVKDTVEMMIGVMNGTYKQPINIGNNHEITINDLVDMCGQVFKDYFKKEAKLNIEYSHIDKDDPKVRQPCLELNTLILGSPKRTSLYDGLLETLQHFDNVIEGIL
jgi:nucleoside-diphosphate-sugar epimerase